MSIAIKTFEHKGLVIHVIVLSKDVTITWKGSSDTRNPSEFLNQVLEGLVAELRGKSVVVDFRALEFMSSATLPAIMTFIRSLESNAIPSVLRFDATIDWQRINYQCMKAIARTLKSIRVEGN